MVFPANRNALTTVFWLAIALAAIGAACAILTARDLVYDGSYYLLGLAGQRTFQLYEPARLSVQLLQQSFAVAGVRMGIQNLWTLGVLFSLGVSGWPVILTALCWVALPRGNKDWIAGPLLNLVFAIPATSFIGIGEGIIASCLLWLAFFLILFRTDKLVGALASVAATAACTYSHEAAFVCLLLIALAALMRITDTKSLCRIGVLVAALIALAGSANMLRWILVPRSAVERGDFLVSILGGFLGTASAPNIPALASVIAAIAIVAVLVRERSSQTPAKTSRPVVFIVIALLAVLFGFLFADASQLIAPSRFFAARGLPVVLTTLLIALFLWLRRRGQTPARFATPPVLAIVLALAIGQTAAQLIITAQWSAYTTALGTVVHTQSGVVSHATAMRLLNPEGARFRRELLESWSVEPLSLVLAPSGRVQALVEAAPGARWVPYDPANPATLPHLPGLDWSHFTPRPVK
ncbi:MAG TPA: hypothetical protein VGK90_04170 [Rhizomicrobium sp.]|jgi:hypothetical protein